MAQKLFIGPRIRKLREKTAMSQSFCAQRLGISNSYLNQIENNQRPVTASVLIKLAEVLDMDIKTLSEIGDKRLSADVRQALQTYQSGDEQIHWQDINQFIEQQPSIALAFGRLFAEHSRLQEEHQLIISRFYGDQMQAQSLQPHEQVRDFFLPKQQPL